jgi:hypothetical protein
MKPRFAYLTRQALEPFEDHERLTLKFLMTQPGKIQRSVGYRADATHAARYLSSVTSNGPSQGAWRSYEGRRCMNNQQAPRKSTASVLAREVTRGAPQITNKEFVEWIKEVEGDRPKRAQRPEPSSNAKQNETGKA